MARIVVNVPEWFDKNYPEYKTILWGMLRAFVASFLATLVPMIQTITVETFSSWENMRIFLLPTIIASITAGIVGLGKFLRSYFEESGTIQKIPV